MNLKIKDKTKKNKENKVVKFKNPNSKSRMNIGIFIFLMLFIYIAAVSIQYFTTHSISTYEVGYGSIIQDTEYTGLILRTEEVYYAEDSGYIQIYYLEGSKVSYGNYIYSLSDDYIDFTAQITSGSEDTLSSTDIQNIINTVQSFNSNYNSDDFYESYDFYDELSSIIQTSVLDEQMSELDSLINSNYAVDVYKTTDVGVISYNIDGYENVTLDTFTSDSLDVTQYNANRVSGGDLISANTPVYKLITSEDWYLVINLNEDDSEIFEESSTIELKFLSDNTTTNAEMNILTQGDETYGIISMSSSMIRYSSQRFTDIEIILDELSGYKIPVTSVISREFYQIPLAYMTKGGENSSYGVLVSNNDGSVSFLETEIYYQDSEYAYIAVSDETKYLKIMMEETSETMRLMEYVDLDGVYVVNKGYAQFKCVSILTESMEYYIVDDSMSFSISNFDHIALYGDSVYDNAIIN